MKSPCAPSVKLFIIRTHGKSHSHSLENIKRSEKENYLKRMRKEKDNIF